MTKAPQKIWACVPADGKRRKETVYGWTTKRGLKAWVEDGDDTGEFGEKLEYVEYIRADLVDAQDAAWSERVAALEATVAAARAEGAWNVAKALRTWVSERQSDVLGCIDLHANEENAALIWLSNFNKAISAASEGQQ
jgi:hypothetical protein